MLRFVAMATVALLLGACSTTAPVPAKHASPDHWGGTYRLKWLQGTQLAGKTLPHNRRVQIRAITPEMTVPGAQSGQDGPQWAISFMGEAGAPLPLTPFAANDYAWMTLSGSHANPPIKCLEAGAFLFICRTSPHTTVQFGESKKDRLTTTTGLFGVALHQGGFELTPLE